MDLVSSVVQEVKMGNLTEPICRRNSLYIWQDRLKDPEKLWTPAIASNSATNAMKKETCKSKPPAALSECRTVCSTSVSFRRNSQEWRRR